MNLKELATQRRRTHREMADAKTLELRAYTALRKTTEAVSAWACDAGEYKRRVDQALEDHNAAARTAQAAADAFANAAIDLAFADHAERRKGNK